MEPSADEQKVIRAVRRAKLFVFLREHRHEVFTEEFQTELAQAYVDSPKGQPPVAPAQLALALILQAYTGVCDDEVIEVLVLDRRWQLVLDCLDTEHAPFAKGTLVGFRTRLIEANLDRQLVERTIEVATATKGFGPRALRAALDSSPLWGAGRVEDTDNLLGHALRKALGVIARQQGRGLSEPVPVTILAGQAGAPVLGGSSLTPALDLDWDDPTARDQALAQVLAALDAVETFVADQPEPDAAMAWVAVAHQVREQDVQPAGDDTPAQLRRGVAKDRRISVEDPQMRHGRKSKSTLVDGYKRHICRDLDSGLVPAVGLTPANAPEASVTESISADLDAQHARLVELHIDRAYLASTLVRDRSDDLTIYCKAWRVRNTGGRFAKTDFRARCRPWTADLPPPGHHAVPARQDSPVPGRDLRRLSAACPVHHQHRRTQHQHPPRRATAHRAPRAPADPRRASNAAPAHHRRARSGPHRALAGTARPLSRHPQEPIRSAPLRGRAQPARHRPPPHP